MWLCNRPRPINTTSRRTITVREIIEQYNFEQKNGVPLYSAGMPNLYGLKGFPIFDEKYREPLLRKIFGHYYMKYIGFETIGMFINRFEQRMSEIMRYYNQLYKSELIEYDPFETNNYTRTIKEDTNTTNDSDGNSQRSGNIKNTENTTGTDKTTTNETTRNVQSDTPKSVLDGGDYATFLVDNTRDNTGNIERKNDTTLIGENSDSQTVNTHDTEDYLRNFSEKVAGNMSMKSNMILLEELRRTFLNIDMDIINELSDLFLTIW